MHTGQPARPRPFVLFGSKWMSATLFKAKYLQMYTAYILIALAQVFTSILSQQPVRLGLNHRLCHQTLHQEPSRQFSALLCSFAQCFEPQGRRFINFLHYYYCVKHNCKKVGIFVHTLPWKQHSMFKNAENCSRLPSLSGIQCSPTTA